MNLNLKNNFITPQKRYWYLCKDCKHSFRLEAYRLGPIGRMIEKCPKCGGHHLERDLMKDRMIIY